MDTDRLSRSDAGWSISRTWAIAPPSGVGYDAAYVVRLSAADGGATHDLVVEYAAPSVLTSIGYAEEIARRFLRESAPPLHVRVDLQGAARAVAAGSGTSGGVAEGS